ncbi:MAG: hypothetical protein ACO306_06480 [Flavobacteriaceae bacterium]
MVCTKSQLVSAINSFGSARATGDGNLIAFSANLIGQLIDTIEFAPEEETTEDTEVKEAEPV